MMRKPSCLISCNQWLPEGSLSVLVGRHGAMNPVGKVIKSRSVYCNCGGKHGSSQLDQMTGRIMSEEFDATEKAGIGAVLNRCRALAAKIANELRNKRPEHFVDKSSLADIHASLELKMSSDRKADRRDNTRSRAVK